MIRDKQIILEKLSSSKFIEFISNFHILTVVIFGSICTEEFNEFSDVDIAILGKNKVSLDNILDIELFLEKFLERPIDVIDLISDNLDIFIKINILNTGEIIHSKDNKESFNKLCDETDRLYRENENFMYFRKVDVLS